MSNLCPGCSENKKGHYKATVFDGSGNAVTLQLCKEHDLELFKTGQIRFVEKYRIPLKGNLLDDVMNAGSDDVFADIA